MILFFYLIAKKKKNENLCTIEQIPVLLDIVKMAEIIHEKQYGNKLKCDLLFAKILERLIENIAAVWKKAWINNAVSKI